jgi:ABC-type branched-subunit amino acid transport system substrate-binding protein
MPASTHPLFQEEFMSRSRIAAGAVLAVALLVSGCGGTRESHEAVERAAGLGAQQQLAAPDAAALGTTGSAAAAPGATAAAENTTTATGGGASAKRGPAAASTPGAQAGQTAQSTGSAPTRAAAPGPATKSTVRLGVVGTFTGPVGALVKDSVTGIRVWSQWVNAHGGVNGHPVELLVGDDGGDPARFITIEQQFVEQKGVVAFVYATLGLAPNGNNKYLESKKILTFGTDGGLELQYTDPWVLSPMPAGLTNGDSILLALGDIARPLNKVKFGSFACSDFAICDNFFKSWTYPGGLKRAGFQLVVQGRPSITQPDFTSQCLSAKQAGAEVVMLSMDTASLRRFAGDCARQNYHPIFGTADVLAPNTLAADPNVDGLIVATKMAPWVDTSVPGIAELHEAFAQFQPGTEVSGGNSNGWIAGKLFEAAGASLPDSVTPAAIADGLYQVKHNDLGGLTYPITMTRGQPMQRQLCYGAVVVKGGKFTKTDGKALRCPANGGAGMAGNQNSTAAGASAPAPEVAPNLAIAARPTVIAEPDCGPARVAGLSYFLDAIQTGASAGPGVFYGAALAVLGTPLPEPLAGPQGQFLAGSGSAVEQFAQDGPAAIQQIRGVVAPLSAGNESGNALIEAGATGMDTAAVDFGPLLQPGDTSLHQLAAATRDAEAPTTAC